MALSVESLTRQLFEPPRPPSRQINYDELLARIDRKNKDVEKSVLPSIRFYLPNLLARLGLD